MPLFACEKCGCIENTACCGYWHRNAFEKKATAPNPALCSLCDPEIGVWHGNFPRRAADGYVETDDGFIWTPDEAKHEADRFKRQGIKIKRTIPCRVAGVVGPRMDGRGGA